MRSSRNASPNTILWVGAATVLMAALLGAAWWLTSGGDEAPDEPDGTAVARPNETPPTTPSFDSDLVPERPVRPIAVQPHVAQVYSDTPSVARAALGGPEGGIFGRTVNLAGEPVPGATVSLYVGNVMLSGGGFPGSREAVDVSAVSDAAGKFVLKSVPVDKAYVVVAEHDDYAKAEIPNIAVREGQMTGEIELRLKEGAKVCGVVQSAVGGAPIAGARVELYYTLNMVWQKPEDQKPWKVVFTNGAGNFCLTHVSEPSIKVRVSADGYETLTIPKSYALEATPHDENLRFELSPGQSLPGRVVTDTNLGVPNARVEATGQAGDFISNSVAYSDEQGYFLLEGMGPGNYTVRATCEGYSDASMNRVTVTAGQIQLTMSQRGAVRGWVVSAANAPVTEFSLHLLRNHPTAGPNYLNRTNTYSDPEGFFLFDDLDPGEYALEARADGYADARSAPFTIVKNAPAPEQVRIVMSRGGTLTGEIISPDGQPVPAALVSLNSNNHVESQISRLFRQLAPSDERERKQRTGSDGMYRFEHIPAGVYQVAVEHDQFAPKALNDITVNDDELGGNAPLDIRLPPGASIAGRAIGLDSAPMPFCKVQISQSETGFMDAGMTDADGRFAFSNLREGQYQVTVNPDRVNGEPVHPFVRLVYAQRSMIEIYVAEGQQRNEVTIKLHDR